VAPAAGQGGLGLEGGRLGFDAPSVRLELVAASQTAAALRPVADPSFDFTPGDWLDRRSGDGHYHLGDLTLRIRTGGAWLDVSTAVARRPVLPLPADGRTLASADLAPTLPADLPLAVHRHWEARGDGLVLRFEIRNTSERAVEIGALGIPMIFNSILHGRELDEAHAVASFHDPYIGRDAGYVQVVRLDGHGPVLLVVPEPGTPLEAWNPLLSDSTRRGVTFEGFHEWMAHSAAYAETEWAEAEPWNAPTSAVLRPGEARSYGIRFLVAPDIRAIEETLAGAGRPVAVGIPGYVLPLDQDGRLFVKSPREILSVDVEPPGALDVEPSDPAPDGWRAYRVRGVAWGRARVSIVYDDGDVQTVHYRVIDPAADVVDALGRFLTTEQWFERPDDPFGRSPGIITWDAWSGRQVTEDHRAWIAGLGDEGGSGSWLAAVMKQLLRPDRDELARIQRFVEETLWGGLQYTDAHPDTPYGVRKSLFFWEPDAMPAGTYSPDVPYGGWSSWSREHAESVGRSYNYPHVAAAYWVLYRLARTRDGLVTSHGWEWYLDRAWRTGVAMTRHAPHYAQFGQMEGTVFVHILEDLAREGWDDAAAEFEGAMRARAEHWLSLGYPFGSEMPWDSTGQEEVYAWCRHFGFDEKARVTVDAVLAYMPTLPHWGYNGSARRYWDFQYAGHPALARVERQLHHYGSGLNALPVLAEYRRHPEDLHLLRVGYGGLVGAIANVTRDGFGPSGFHAFPSSLRIDGYSGDYGPGFLGHALGAASYLVHDERFGWLGFGGNVTADGGRIRLEPRDAGSARVFVAPIGLWLTLDAGTIEAVDFEPGSGEVTLTLAPATADTPRAYVRAWQRPESRRYAPSEPLETDRDAWVVGLAPVPTALRLHPVR
jgi:hypothetical protein